MNVLIAIYSAIRNEFDMYSAIRMHLADKNLILSGGEGHWIALTVEGDVIARSKTPADLAGQLLGR